MGRKICKKDEQHLFKLMKQFDKAQSGILKLTTRLIYEKKYEIIFESAPQGLLQVYLHPTQITISMIASFLSLAYFLIQNAKGLPTDECPLLTFKTKNGHFKKVFDYALMPLLSFLNTFLIIFVNLILVTNCSFYAIPIMLGLSTLRTLFAEPFTNYSLRV